nr:uncharacterized protein LOC123284122 [Equus asinus]
MCPSPSFNNHPFTLTGFLNKPARPRRYQELGSAYAVARLQPPEGTRPGPRPQSSHPPCARAPQGPPPDTPVRLCVHRPEAQNQRRAALLGLLGAAAFARARALASRAPGPGSGRFSPLQFHRDFRASAACLTSRRAQRGSGWSDTCQRAAVTPDLRLPFRFRALLPLCKLWISLCSFPVEESQGGLIRFGRCTTMVFQTGPELQHTIGQEHMIPDFH